MPFHLGSLSFLTPMPYNEHKKELEALFSGNQTFRATLRMRLSCTIYRYCPQVEQSARQCRKTGCLWTKKESCKWQLLETAWMKKHLSLVESTEPNESRSRSVPAYASVPTDTFEVLNEVVVDRGPCAYMASLELFGDNQHLTTVQADGLVIGTPTGSTAYSVMFSLVPLSLYSNMGVPAALGRRILGASLCPRHTGHTYLRPYAQLP